MDKKIPVPRIASPYRNIYSPASDVYLGIDTPSFKYGERYDNWIANDFTMIKDKGGVWHAYGITHPKPPTFINDFDYSGEIHEAEYQLFHAAFKGSLEELYNGGSFVEQEKILYPQSRPNQVPSCWSPCIIEKDGLYHLFYSPQAMRLATSRDLYSFDIAEKELFSGDFMLRDPYIFKENDLYTMVYVFDNLYFRTSSNLLHWSEEKLFQKNPFSANASQESPCIIKRGEFYYLIWCVYDGQNGVYDNRSFVFAAEDPMDFTGKAPVAMLKGHASEIISENGQDYIISVFYPENGLNIAKIEWE